MTVTKEECEKALNNLITTVRINTGMTPIRFMAYLDSLKFEKETLEQLIKEHFELVEEYHDLSKDYIHYLQHINPPLKYEEIKPYMWVWDDENIEYIFISGVGFDDDIMTPNGYIKFTEGRFYRKEVKENAQRRP